VLGIWLEGDEERWKATCVEARERMELRPIVQRGMVAGFLKDLGCSQMREKG